LEIGIPRIELDLLALLVVVEASTGSSTRTRSSNPVLLRPTTRSCATTYQKLPASTTSVPVPVLVVLVVVLVVLASSTSSTSSTSQQLDLDQGGGQWLVVLRVVVVVALVLVYQ
jgi:hypothetical protein